MITKYQNCTGCKGCGLFSICEDLNDDASCPCTECIVKTMCSTDKRNTCSSSESWYFRKKGFDPYRG